MTRVKTGPYRRRKHRKVLKRTKGYRQTRSKHFRSAHEADLHAGSYAYAGRRLKKRDLRRLWITRINAAVRQTGLAYSQFINLLQKAHVGLNRKILAHLAVEDPEGFKQLVKYIQSKN
jgi:large subunit ribosomal protein L20